MEKLEKAIFAGGCFWCLEPSFETLPGVLEVRPGYVGGNKEKPTYEEVCTGMTGHREAVQIVFNPSKVTYRELLDVFWKQIDPTDLDGQFVDQGPQYRTAIFYLNNEQKRLAEFSKKKLEQSIRFKKPIVTDVIRASRFYLAEDYHHHYHKKCSLRYKYYRTHSGRDQYLKRIWREEKDASPVKNLSEGFTEPTKEQLKKILSPLQKQITQQNGTENPFHNEYWDNKKEGIYVDIVSGEPLFSSRDKFDSGTGWPSFTRSLNPENIVEKKDKSLPVTRTEVRSKHADSHLGHVFSDGPAPTYRTSLLHKLCCPTLHPQRESGQERVCRIRENF